MKTTEFSITSGSDVQIDQDSCTPADWFLNRIVRQSSVRSKPAIWSAPYSTRTRTCSLRYGFTTITIRIGRKAMTLGGDSSRAAIARSSAIRETKRLASIELAQDDRVQRPSKLWSGMHVSEPKAKSL